ncbi:MAG TPA: hypothetical protein VEF55_00390 [Candidatus Binatia bacterium]|nr:hypothetical protein [Candidatus Binatia bacterium]
MGALRRPQQWETPKPNPEGSASVEPRIGRPYPRWLVVSGLVFYCAAVWVLVVVAGSWGVELIRTATAQP